MRRDLILIKWERWIIRATWFQSNERGDLNPISLAWNSPVCLCTEYCSNSCKYCHFMEMSTTNNAIAPMESIQRRYQARHIWFETTLHHMWLMWKIDYIVFEFYRVLQLENWVDEIDSDQNHVNNLLKSDVSIFINWKYVSIVV